MILCQVESREVEERLSSLHAFAAQETLPLDSRRYLSNRDCCNKSALCSVLYVKPFKWLSIISKTAGSLSSGSRALVLIVRSSSESYLDRPYLLQTHAPVGDVGRHVLVNRPTRVALRLDQICQGVVTPSGCLKQLPVVAEVALHA